MTYSVASKSNLFDFSGALTRVDVTPRNAFGVNGASDIHVLKIISVLVSIKFEINHLSISFYTVSAFFSVLVSIKLF